MLATARTDLKAAPLEGLIMRLAHLLAALCLGTGIQLTWAAAESDPPPHPTPAVEKSSAPTYDDAAERHIKRTACLRQAREKKLLGADKTAFLKSCIAAP
jgi:hypothetical protein